MPKLELPDKPFLLIAAELDHIWRREDRSAEALADYARRNPGLSIDRPIEDARADARALAEARNFFMALLEREEDVRSLLTGLFVGAGDAQSEGLSKRRTAS